MYIAGRDWFLLVKNENKIQFKTKNKLPSITSHAWYNSQAHDHKPNTLTRNSQKGPLINSHRIYQTHPFDHLHYFHAKLRHLDPHPSNVMTFDLLLILFRL